MHWNLVSHNNSAHSTNSVWTFPATNSRRVIPHPSYRLDLIPCDTSFSQDSP